MPFIACWSSNFISGAVECLKPSAKEGTLIPAHFLGSWPLLGMYVCMFHPEFWE